MDSNVLVSLLVILLPLSFISERITNLVKLFLPTSNFLSIGNVRYRENNPLLEKKRERRIFLISLLSGELVAFSLKADLFTILNSGKFGWDEPASGFSWIIGCLFTGFFLSWGSKFWHDLLGIILEAKNMRRAIIDEKNLDVQLRAFGAQENSSPSEGVAAVTIKPNQPQAAKPEFVQDKPTLQRIAKLHPLLREEAKEIYLQILAQGIAVRFTDTLRTFAEQDELYAKGRTKPGKIVTQAKAGQSFHNYGLALDFCLLLADGREASWDRHTDINLNLRYDWDEVVALFRHYGWEWGGDWVNFKDYPHFQKTFGLSTAQLLKLYNRKEVDGEGYVVIKENGFS